MIDPEESKLPHKKDVFCFTVYHKLRHLTCLNLCLILIPVPQDALKTLIFHIVGFPFINIHWNESISAISLEKCTSITTFRSFIILFQKSSKKDSN